MAAKAKPLNVRHERFCVAKAAGMSTTDAYLDAGFKVSRPEARKNGSKLAAKPDIIAKIAKLMAPMTKEKLMSRDEKRRIMAKIARDEKVSKVDRIRAASEDAKLAGHYEPERHVVDAGPSTLEMVRERMRGMSSPLSAAPKGQ